MAVIKEYQKKDGSKAYMFNAYVGVNQLTGKKMRTTRRGFKTSKEAKLALATLELEVAKNGFEKKKRHKFSSVYIQWMKQHQNTVRGSTKQNIEKLFRNQIIPELGKYYIDAITTNICQEAVNGWAEKMAAYPLIKSYASKVFDYAINNRMTDDNPMKRVIMPRKNTVRQKKKFDDFYSKDELEKLFECVQREKDLRMMAYLRLLAFTGARRGEVHALLWSDFDFERKIVSFSKTLVIVEKKFTINDTKTPEGNRTISIDDKTISIMKKWKAKQKELFLIQGKAPLAKENELVFTNDTGRHNNNYLYLSYGGECMKYLEDMYGIRRIKIHGLRHTHCSLLFESGASLKDVQTRLGHTDIKTTMNVYAHVSKEQEEKTAEKFANFVNF